MSIPEVFKKINYQARSYYSSKVKPSIYSLKDKLDLKEDVFIVLIIILIGLAGFGLGKLSALEKNRGEVKIGTDFIEPSTTAVKINTEVNVPLSAAAMVSTESAKGLLVASKTGKKYHFPWCAGASQIAEKNKIWFSTYESAQKAGYTAATNCPGLK